MTTSTLTLPANALSVLPPAARPGSSFSNARHGSGSEGSVLPTGGRWYSNDQEAIEMNTLGGKPAFVSSNVSPAIPAWTMSTRDEWIAIATCCACFFTAGWNDATTGPLLPTIQAYYGVNFTIVSMLFVSNCVGFMSAAVLNIHLTDRLGFGKVILLGSVLQVIACALLAPALPFPVMCVLYSMNGFGNSLKNAQANGFIAELPSNTSAKLGLSHAAYGAGAFVVPFIATRFAQTSRWSFHYLTSLGVSLATATATFFVFKLRMQQEILGARAHAETSETSQQNKYKEIFGSRVVQSIAFFAWVYVGVEVTIGGWIVTFVIEERGGGSSAGYISSGFFGGLMLGRVILLWVNAKIGERRVVYIYCVLAVALELVIWLVPNLIGNAVAVSLVGLLLGYLISVALRKARLIPQSRPMYPIALSITGAIVPRRILTGSIGWIASFGQAESAVFPFIAGVLSQKHGVKVLQPLLVGMLVALILLWAFVPMGQKRRGD